MSGRVASTAAGVEYIFSRDGLVQSKLCSQLSNDKTSKLVFLVPISLTVETSQITIMLNFEISLCVNLELSVFRTVDLSVLSAVQTERLSVCCYFVQNKNTDLLNIIYYNK